MGGYCSVCAPPAFYHAKSELHTVPLSLHIPDKGAHLPVQQSKQSTDMLIHTLPDGNGC